MRPASRGVKLTYDDYVLFPDDGKRHELIDGRALRDAHADPQAPGRQRQSVTVSSGAASRSSIRIGRVFAAPFDVIFSDFDVVEPDLLYISNRTTWHD